MMSDLGSHWDSFNHDPFPTVPSWSSSTSSAGSTSSSSSPDFGVPSPLAASVVSSISNTAPVRRQRSDDMLEDDENDDEQNKNIENSSSIKYSAWTDMSRQTATKEIKSFHYLKVEDVPPPVPFRLSSFSSCSSASSPISPKLESPANTSSSTSSPSNLSPTSRTSSSSLELPSSSSSSSISSRTGGSRRRPRSRPPSSSARLESHRKYDSKRRRTFRSLFEQLRGILKSADSTATHAKCVLQSSLEANELEMRMAALEKNIEDLSTRELMLRSAKMIRQLTEAKAKLQRQLEEEPDTRNRHNSTGNDNALAETLEEAERSSLVPSKKRRKDGAFSSSSLSLSSSSSSDSSSSSTSMQIADAASMDCLNTLVHTITVLSQFYNEEMQNVERQQLTLPQSFTDISCYFPALCVSGADGRMALFPELVGEEYRAIRSWLNECNSRGIDLLSTIRDPLTYQIHALAFVLSNNFAYKSHQLLEAPAKAQRKTNGHLQANTVFQSLYQSIQTHQQHAASAAAATFSSITDLAPWGCSAEISEEELQRHPLGGYALPAASSRALLEVLAHLVSLGESECQRQINQLLPIAFATFPTLFSTQPLPFLGMTTREQPIPNKIRRLHPLLDPSFELISKFYDLYSGSKPMITVVRPIPSPNSRILYAERDVMLVRHSSGLPLAHLTCNVRLRFGDEMKY